MQQRFSTCSDLLIVDCSLRQALVGPYISKLHINKLHIACTVICMCRLMHVQTYVCGILHTGLIYVVYYIPDSRLDELV